MEHQPFTIAQICPIRDCMTVSRPANLGKEVPVTWFSLGAGTTITPESYDCTTLYVGAMGNGRFILGEDGRAVPFAGDDFLAVPPKTLCGTSTDIGMIYTEIILKKENTMEQLEKIISIIKRVGEATIDPNLVITGDTDIVADLQFDSIDMVLIVGEIEEAFGISIENDMIQEIRTVNDLNEKVRQLSA